MIAQEFASIFRDEHRAVRDALFELIDVFQARESERAREIVGRIAVLAGPHFRYEEEALYPALVDTFGKEYIERLLTDHDGAIETARQLAALAAQDTLTEEEAEEATKLARSILPHVSDCEGLSIMTERFDEGALREVLAARVRSNSEGLDLLRWAEEVRRRPSLS